MRPLRLKEDITYILPDRYYICTYMPKWAYKNSYLVSEDKFLKKHITGVPFFSRYHIRKNLSYFFSPDIAKSVDIVKGDKLIKQGITKVPVKRFYIFYYQNKSKSIKGMPRFIMPPEYSYDKHRRRRYNLIMTRIYLQYGSRKFDYRYQLELYGFKGNFSREYLAKENSKILSTLSQTLPTSFGERKKIIRHIFEGLPLKYLGFSNSPIKEG